MFRQFHSEQSTTSNLSVIVSTFIQKFRQVSRNFLSFSTETKVNRSLELLILLQKLKPQDYQISGIISGNQCS